MDILLVDDDDTLRQSLQILLESEEFTVFAASSGEEAVEMAKQRYFDLVLCDVRMPGIDGLETIRQLQDSVADAHFLVMTGYASQEAPIEALRLGVDDYLNKPFDIPLFLEKVRAIARRRKIAVVRPVGNLWELIDSVQDLYPELAIRCHQVEGKCIDWAANLGLGAQSQETLRLASWLHPLGLVQKHLQGESQEEELEARPSDEIVRLLRSVLSESAGDLAEESFRAAVAICQGRTPPSSTHQSLTDLLENEEANLVPQASPVESQQDLRVTSFGGFELRLQGEVLPRKAWQSASARWLFVYLLSRGGQSVPEDRLATLLWPGSPAKKAHRALVSSVHRIRKALGNNQIVARYDKSYGIDRELDCFFDSDVFQTEYKNACQAHFESNPEKAKQHFQAALELYRGHFLPECQDSWCQRMREQLQLKAADAAEKLAQIELENNPTSSESWSRRALSIEPCSEPAWASLFRALAAQGRRAEVEGAYRECVETLQENLQLNPEAIFAKLMRSVWIRSAPPSTVANLAAKN